jgi:hypothetical protein
LMIRLLKSSEAIDENSQARSMYYVMGHFARSVFLPVLHHLIVIASNHSGIDFEN